VRVFGIIHDSARNGRAAEVSRITHGLHETAACYKCGGVKRFPVDDLDVEVHLPQEGFWPDLLACGTYSCFAISDRVVNAVRLQNIPLFVGGRIRVARILGSAIPSACAPEYSWIDGNRHRTATIDFNASGYVDVRYCSECGARSYNTSATFRNRIASAGRLHLNLPEKMEFDIFTSDLSPVAFFCTQRFKDLIESAKFSNFRFYDVDHTTSCVQDR
jgi:hypothetical protein